MSNPLVAQKQDSTTWHSGINVLDDAAGVYDGVQSGSWIEGGIAALGTGLDLLTMAMNPVGTLISYGLNWLIEHVKPLQDALNKLAGDADQIAAYSQTWANVGQAVQKAAKDLAATVEKDTANWTGQAADTYRANLKDKIDHINAAATCANTISTVVKIVGVITGAVRAMVRDMVTQAVGDFIQDALEEVCSLGLGTPAVVAQVVEQVSAWMEKIGALIKKLINSVEALRPMMSKLEEIFGAIKKVMSELHGHAGGEEPHLSGDGTTPSSAIDEPRTTTEPHSNGDGTTPSRTADGSTPDGTPSDSPTTPSESRTGGEPESPNRPADPQETSTEVKGRTCENDPVDVASGEMVLHQRDVLLDGLLELELTRTHVSSYRAGRWFGRTWSSTLDQRLEPDGRGVVFLADQGVTLVYPPARPGESVLPEEGPRRTLTNTGEGYTVTDPETGQVLEFAASGSGALPLRRITDRNGHWIAVDYDDGVPVLVRHSGGYRIAVHTEHGLITRLSLLAGENREPVALVDYRYDDARRLTDVINSSGRPMRFGYDPAGRIIRWEDRNGEWYTYDYDEHGRCVRNEGSGGFLNGTFDYGDRVTTFTNSLGLRTTYHLNERNQVIRQTDPLGNTTLSEWDRYHRLLSRTDPLGRTTRYERDAAGNITTVLLPDGSRVSGEYNEFHQPTTVVEADGAVWRQDYDARGNLISVTDPAGAATNYEYDEQGRLHTVTDALGQVRRIVANAAGLPVAVTDARGGTTRYGRDVFGRVASVTDPLGGITRLGWTVEGKLFSRTLPDGATERWTFDGEGNETGYRDALGRITRTQTTHFDLPAGEIRPDGSRLEFGYDTELRLTSVTNAAGLVWRYEYDAAGRLVRETDFNGRTLTYRHDAAGQLIERTNGAGEVTTYRYDLAGNLVEQNAAGSVRTFQYDAAGRLLRAGSPAADVVFERDPLGRVLAESINGSTVASRYDALGRRTSRTTPSGAVSTWEYGAAESPVSLHTAGRTIRFGYDRAGREVAREFAGATLVQSWDANHRLRSQVLRAGGQAGPLQQRDYNYRPDGVLTGVDDRLGGRRRFELDTANRVTAVHAAGWTERYAYDTAGNLAHAQWPAQQNDADAAGHREHTGTLVRTAGNVSYRHDAQGRLVLRRRKRLSAKADVWHYSWDGDDRLTGVVTPDGSRWRYQYDALGRRIAKQRLGPDGETVLEQVDFAWDGSVIAEQTQHGERPHTTTWDWKPGTLRPVAQTERVPVREAPQQWIDEQFYAIVTDLVGTPTELVDEEGGIAWHAQSTLWGVALGSLTARASTPLRFPGQYFDPETGLNYNFHRYYDPLTASYGSADPLALTGGPNPHGYVANPWLWIDPFGLSACVWDKVEGTQPPREVGSALPKSFNLTTESGEKIWVNPNATKHIWEETNNLSGQSRNVAEQVRLSSLSKAVDKATADGVPGFEKMVVQDGWELIFSAPRSAGLNPVLKHARYLGG